MFDNFIQSTLIDAEYWFCAVKKLVKGVHHNGTDGQMRKCVLLAKCAMLRSRRS